MTVVNGICEQACRELARTDEGRVRVSERNDVIPDVAGVPAAFTAPFEHDPRALNALAEPLPLVVDGWPRTPARFANAVEPQTYRERGDEEIWSIHPYERTLTAWRRQPEGRSRGGGR